MASRKFSPKLASSIVSGGLFLAFAMVAGCDSGTDSSTTSQQSATRNEQVRQEEQKANDALKKQMGTKAPVLRSIKGGINQAPPEAK